MIVNVHAAKSQLSKLLERAEAGEEVIIARAGKPVARLAPIAEPVAAGRDDAEQRLPSWVGSLAGQIRIADDVEGEWWQELVRQMEEGPIFPDDDPRS